MTDVTPIWKEPKGKRSRPRNRPTYEPRSIAWTMELSVPIVVERSHGRCEHPDGCDQRATVFHHRRGRGFPGCHAPSLILHLCEICHVVRTHGQPRVSYRNGAMLSRVAPLPFPIEVLPEDAS